MAASGSHQRSVSAPRLINADKYGLWGQLTTVALLGGVVVMGLRGFFSAFVWLVFPPAALMALLTAGPWPRGVRHWATGFADRVRDAGREGGVCYSRNRLADSM